MKGEGDQGSRVAGARIEGRSASGVEGRSKGGVVSTHSTGSSIGAADGVAFLAIVIVETKLSNP